MKPTPLDELARRMEGTLRNAKDPVIVTGFATDSRHVQPGDLFLCIRGERTDGHEYVEQALAAGAVATLSERTVPGPTIRAASLVKSLARLGLSYRAEFTGPVIGITGSAGKTTTKEFAAAALEPLGAVLKTEGNRNTEFTSPLLWAELRPDHRAAVIEMAMRGFGQIAHLAAISQPQIAIITNIGFAHLQQVGSRSGIAKAKGELLEALPAGGTAILWRGDPYFPTLEAKAHHATLRTFGYTEGADCRILDYRAVTWNRALLRGTLDGQSWEAAVPVVGRHVALNAAAAILAAATAGVAPAEAAARIERAQLPPMRMQVIEWEGRTIVLDAYNASPPAMVGAIETLSELAEPGRRLAVLGEMKELGEYSEELHQSIGAAVAQHRIDRVAYVGTAMNPAWNEAIRAGVPADRFSLCETAEETVPFLKESRPGDTILIKGSRALELERALTQLGVSF